MKKVKFPTGIRFAKSKGVIDYTRIEIRFTYKTKPYTYTVKYEGLTEAKLLQAQLKAQVSKSDHIDPARMNLNQLLDQYISTRKRESTKISNKNNYDQFVKRSNNIGSMRIDKIKTFHLQNVIDQLIEEGIAPKTIRNYFSPISASLNHAEKQGLIPHKSPTKNVNRPAVKKTEVNMWSLDQYNEFITQAKMIADSYGKLNQYHRYSSHYLLMVDFIRHTGMRVYEVCGLKWDDFDADTNEITINKTLKYTTGSSFVIEDTKTSHSERTIPLTIEASKILEELYFHIDNPFIFNIGGKPFRSNNVARVFTKFAKELNMPLPFRLRDNRKLFISEALSLGVPPQDIADYCGTSIEQISKTYGRSDDQSLLKLAKVMGSNG